MKLAEFLDNFIKELAKDSCQLDRYVLNDGDQQNINPTYKSLYVMCPV